MMNRILIFASLLLSSFAGVSQTNVAPLATASHQVGGATTSGPQNYNDKVITATPSTTPWGWTTTNGWIEYVWSAPQKDITKVKFWKGDRPMTSCDIQYWDGTSYITLMTYSGVPFVAVDSVMLPVPITTTRLKFDKVAGSTNPNHREIEVFAGPACPEPTNFSATSVLINSASITWKAAAGSIGYDYFVDENPDPVWPFKTTFTTATSVTLTGLKPGTKYYLHVVNKCSPTNFWTWANFPFTTLPACKFPGGFSVTKLNTNSATLNWFSWPSTLTYDYVVDELRTDPTSTTSIVNTTATSVNVAGLKENTWYFVHRRSLCVEGLVSSWSLDSFLTSTICREPVVEIGHVNTDEAVAHWDAIPTAVSYEYAITTSSTPPAFGTKYPATTLHTSALHDGKEYFVHVRSQCSSQGFESVSNWSTASFKTFPVSVNDVAGEALRISLYPNPTQGDVTVNLSRLHGSAKLEVMDLSGRILMQQKLTGEKNIVDAKQLAAGVYLLKYSSDDYTRTFGFVKE